MNTLPFPKPGRPGLCRCVERPKSNYRPNCAQKLAGGWTGYEWKSTRQGGFCRSKPIVELQSVLPVSA